LKTSRRAMTVKSTPHGFRTFNGTASETGRTFLLFFNDLMRNILPRDGQFLPYERRETWRVFVAFA
jgi:hypothetical protein